MSKQLKILIGSLFATVMLLTAGSFLAFNSMIGAADLGLTQYSELLHNIKEREVTSTSVVISENPEHTSKIPFKWYGLSPREPHLITGKTLEEESKEFLFFYTPSVHSGESFIEIHADRSYSPKEVEFSTEFN